MTITRDRLIHALLSAGVALLVVGLIAGGVLLIARRLGASPQAVRWSPEAIAPALALRTLAGEPDALVIEQALDENKLETAFVTLFFSTSLSDKERAAYYLALGQKFAQAKQKERAEFCYGQASSILLFGPSPFETSKAEALLTLGKGWAALGKRAEAERTFDFAYTIARYSPYGDEMQRRFILSMLSSEYKALGSDRKADETLRAQSSLASSGPPPHSLIASPLPTPTLGEEATAATAWRKRAAQRLINSLGSADKAAIEEARRNLEDALRAEDALRSSSVENRLREASGPEARAAVAWSRVGWLALRWRIAQRGFGLSLVPSWEKKLTALGNELHQAMAAYYLIRREMLIALPDAVEAAQGRLDLLREEMMMGKIGLYPEYAENRLISELAQATKERIDLREDGLYVAILSQEGRGSYALTTADLWGRPAAMASAGLSVSFPTIPPPAYVYVPTPTAAPTVVPVVPTMTPTAVPTRPPVVLATATFTALPTRPTQPTSPLATPTTGTIVAGGPTPPPIPTPVPPPTPVPWPPATPTPPPTPTPAYNYQVIYKAGPIVRDASSNDNFHIVGMVVDQNGVLIPGLKQRLSWCCPAGQAVHPRPGIDVDNGRFDFFVGRGQFTLDILDGSATTEPIVINTDVPGLTGYVEWEYTIQRTSRSMPPFQSPTPTPTGSPTATATPLPPSPTPPLPGAVSTRIALDPGWNFIALPLAPVVSYSASSWQAEMNSQIYNQGGGVSQIAAWDGTRISPYAGSIALGVGYFVHITGTNRVFWQMTGYPLVAPKELDLKHGQKNSIAIPYQPGGTKTAAQVQQEIDSVAGAGTFVRLWRLRDTMANWDYYDGTGTGVPSFTIEPHRGYLLEVTRSFTWSPWQPATPTPTPTPTPTETITPTPSATPFDTHEPNDTFDQAQIISPNSAIISYITSPTDRDYYKFEVVAPTTIYLSLTNLPTDYDLYLYSPARTEIDASFLGGQQSEYITRTVTLSGWYYALVQGAGPVYDTIKPYKLLLSFEPLAE